MVIVGVWRDAATAADGPSVDQDVVHDGEPHTLSIAGDHFRRPFVEDQTMLTIVLPGGITGKDCAAFEVSNRTRVH